LKVLSNTTPFIALSSIRQIALLPRLFDRIYIAESVLAECAEGGPVPVPDLKQIPWVTVLPDDDTLALPVQFELDRGEKQTIALALKHSAEIIIMDERIGRRVAEYFGLQVTGTLGVLAKAKTMGLISSFHDAAMGMREEGIYFNVELIARIARHLGE
jgi:uncharacterized protein